MATDSFSAGIYCIHIENDPKVRKYVNRSRHAYELCRHFMKPYSIKKYITCSYFAMKYCLNIKNDPEVMKYITEPGDIEIYNLNKGENDPRIEIK